MIPHYSHYSQSLLTESNLNETIWSNRANSVLILLLCSGFSVASTIEGSGRSFDVFLTQPGDIPLSGIWRWIWSWLGIRILRDPLPLPRHVSLKALTLLWHVCGTIPGHKKDNVPRSWEFMAERQRTATCGGRRRPVRRPAIKYISIRGVFSAPGKKLLHLMD